MRPALAFCGTTGGSWVLLGYQESDLTWGVQFSSPYTTSSIGLNWTLNDEQSIIASGTWTNTPGQFTASRFPIGESDFVISGYIQNAQNGCQDSISFQSGKDWNLPFTIVGGSTFKFKFTNKHSGLVAEVPGSSLQDGLVLDQAAYNSGSNQKWIVPNGGSAGVGKGYRTCVGQLLDVDCVRQLG
jgi:hypothetical protein